MINARATNLNELIASRFPPPLPNLGEPKASPGTHTGFVEKFDEFLQALDSTVALKGQTSEHIRGNTPLGYVSLEIRPEDTAPQNSPDVHIKNVASLKRTADGCILTVAGGHGLSEGVTNWIWKQQDGSFITRYEKDGRREIPPLLPAEFRHMGGSVSFPVEPSSIQTYTLNLNDQTVNEEHSEYFMRDAWKPNPFQFLNGDF